MFLEFNRLSGLAFFQILSKLLLVRSKEPPGAYRVTPFPSLWPSPINPRITRDNVTFVPTRKDSKYLSTILAAVILKYGHL